MSKEKTPDTYFEGELKYSIEMNELRRILLKSGLTETLKWGIPTYCFGKENVVGMCEFKHHFGMWFYQGALLADVPKKLINANEENTKALRQWRMTSLTDIDEKLILEYIFESIENCKLGKKIAPDRDKPVTIPEELRSSLSKNASFGKAFEGLNKTKKREYCEYIESAKRIETKLQRIEKIIPMVISGIGLNDKYRK